MTAAHLLAAPIEAPVEEADAHGVSWLSPEAKLWVASRDGEFGGFVEFVDGHYEVTDARGHQLEPRGTLREAKELIGGPAPRAGAPLALVYLAVGTGATAVSFLAVGLGLIRIG